MFSCVSEWAGSEYTGNKRATEWWLHRYGLHWMDWNNCKIDAWTPAGLHCCSSHHSEWVQVLGLSSYLLTHTIHTPHIWPSLRKHRFAVDRTTFQLAFNDYLLHKDTKIMVTKIGGNISPKLQHSKTHYHTSWLNIRLCFSSTNIHYYSHIYCWWPVAKLHRAKGSRSTLAYV